jgi:hypothetical protein
MCHMPCTPHSPWFYLPNDIWLSTNYETPHCATFFILPLPHLSYIQIFSSVTCSHTPPVCALPLIWEIKLHTHTKELAELVLPSFLPHPFNSLFINHAISLHYTIWTTDSIIK